MVSAVSTDESHRNINKGRKAPIGWLFGVILAICALIPLWLAILHAFSGPTALFMNIVGSTFSSSVFVVNLIELNSILS